MALLILPSFFLPSTASCIWQSIVLLCSCLKSIGLDFSGRSLQEQFPYATLLGSPVDTFLASVYEAFWKNFSLFVLGCGR